MVGVMHILGVMSQSRTGACGMSSLKDTVPQLSSRNIICDNQSEIERI